jgi:hypothetical protein
MASCVSQIIRLLLNGCSLFFSCFQWRHVILFFGDVDSKTLTYLSLFVCLSRCRLWSEGLASFRRPTLSVLMGTLLAKSRSRARHLWNIYRNTTHVVCLILCQEECGMRLKSFMKKTDKLSRIYFRRHRRHSQRRLNCSVRLYASVRMKQLENCWKNRHEISQFYEHPVYSQLNSLVLHLYSQSI